ncbi:ATV_collapsed_G0047950.mRNA.1.CDS.1 [Saccharomyces cerevisiae]|nr:ATV_collapsed_G0047950.mRNA.1.CDS.1 [Saccharomyces cerevisiae]
MEINAGVLAHRELGEAHGKRALTPVKTRIASTRLITGILGQTFCNLLVKTTSFSTELPFFKSVGLTDGFETSIVLGTVNFFSLLFSVVVVDKIGQNRKYTHYLVQLG